MKKRPPSSHVSTKLYSFSYLDEAISEAFDVVQVNKEKYVKACKECGVVPASYFLRNMTNVRLNMSHHGLGPKGAKAIAIGLMVGIYITFVFVKNKVLVLIGNKRFKVIYI